jgi:hypothetical protein
MLATIIISNVLAAIVGLIVYRLIKNARSGKGQCSGCAYAGTCSAAKYIPRKSECDTSDQHS